MFYVVRKGEPLESYYSSFGNFEKAKEYADQLKFSFGHQYDVIKMETVWTTQTLEELRKQEAF